MDSENGDRRGNPHWLMGVLGVGVLAYLGWRLATIVGDPSVAAVVLWIVEVLAWTGVAAFLARAGRPFHAARSGPIADLPADTVVAVLASGRSPSAVEHTLASLETGTSAPAVLVVDDAARTDISELARASGATVLACDGPGVAPTLAALTATVPDDAAVVLVEAGSLLAAGALDALVAPMADATVAAVQGALDWADPATITVHGPSRDGQGVVSRQAPADGRAGVAPILGDGVALRVRALHAIGSAGPDLTVAFASAGWLVRFVDTPVVYRPRPASAAQWRADRSMQIADACRSARAAVRAPGLRFTTRARVVAATGDVASAYARVGLVAIVVTALLSGSVPVPGPLGTTILAAAVLWLLATAAVHASVAPVLRAGDRVRLGWHRLDADLLGPFSRPRRDATTGGRIRSLASFPVSVVALLAVDVAAFVRGLALVRPSVVPEIPTTLARATIGVVALSVLALLVDSLRIFVARPDARIDLRVPARVAAIVGSQAAELRDLSPTGAGLTCGEALARGTAVQLRFTLPDGDELAVDGTVARVDHVATAAGSSAYHLGVQFGAMSPETHRALVRYVATTAPGAAAAASTGALPRVSAVPLPRPALRFASVMAIIVAAVSLVAAPAVAAPPTPTATTEFVGTVSDANGPLEGACVSAVSPDWQWWTVVTDASGTYTLDVPVGDYRIQVRDCSPDPDPAPRLAGGWWSATGLQGQSGAQTVSGAENQVSAPMDITLPVGGWLTGAVQDADGTPLDGICVNPVSAQHDWDNGTTTPSNGGAAGTYETGTMLPGQYHLSVTDCSGRPEPFVRGWIAGDGSTVTPFENDARAFDVAGGATAAGTVTLPHGTRITGTVTDDGGTPVGNVCVAALGDNWSWVGGGNTAPDGTYSTDVLPAGDWVLSFNDCNSPATLVNVLWNGSSAGTNDFAAATRIHTDASTPVAAGHDQAMTRGGSISGTVRTAAGPQGDVCLNALQRNGSDNWNWLNGTRSANDGTFTIDRIPPGDVSLYANSCDGDPAVLEGMYVAPGEPVTRNQDDAATLQVTAGETLGDLDVVVELGAVLSGTVTADGVPLDDACVSALDPATGYAGSSDTRDGGTWRTVVPQGSYLVQATACRSGRAVAATFLGGAQDPAGVQPVTAAPGDALSGLDIDLPSANPGGVHGRLTTSSGLAPQACVVVVAPQSEPVAFGPDAADGTFDLAGINPGAYLVGIAGCDFGDDGLPPGVVDPADPSVTYPLQWSSGRAISQDTLWSDPTWVVVTADASTDLGTICLSPCPDAPVDALPGPTTPTSPPAVSGTPGGFVPDPAPEIGTPVPDSASSPSSETQARRAIAPAPPAAAVKAAKTAGTVVPTTTRSTVISGHAKSAVALHSGSTDGDGGSTSWWWLFAVAAVIAAVAAGVPWLRSRNAAG